MGIDRAGLTDKHRSKTAQRLRSLLRELWSKSPYRQKALDAAKVGRNEYRCACCKNTFNAYEMEIDHLVEMPVAKYTDVQAIDWNAFIAALFCEQEGLQALCKLCHAKKTAEYSLIRELGANLV